MVCLLVVVFCLCFWVMVAVVCVQRVVCLWCALVSFRVLFVFCVVRCSCFVSVCLRFVLCLVCVFVCGLIVFCV